MIRISLVLVIVISLIGRSGSGQAAQVEPTVNVELIVDSSGSMAAETDVGTLRIDAAQQVLTDVISSIPSNSGINVGLRVYGHEGNNQDSGRAESCVSSALKVPLQGVNKVALQAAVEGIVPTGWTPLGYSLEEAAADFTMPASDNVTNAVVLLTDGIETCDGDPVAAAASLQASPAQVTTHVVGFGTTQEDQATLAAIAEAGEGKLLGSNNAGQLLDALFSILEQLDVVETSGSGASREDPVAFGRIARVGDFDVSVTDTQVVQSSRFANNQQSFTAKIAVTYQGITSARPSQLLSFSAVGDLNSSYTIGNNSCGTSEGLGVLSVNELFPGGSAEFDVCWLVASEDMGSLVMYVDSLIPQEKSRVWFSLDDSTIGATEDESISSQPSAEASDNPVPSGEVFLDATDIAFNPKELSIPANTNVALTITNVGVLDHDFVIDAAGIDSGVLRSGESVTVTVNLPPGIYEFYCSVPGHKEAGQTGTLVVS